MAYKHDRRTFFAPALLGLVFHVNLAPHAAGGATTPATTDSPTPKTISIAEARSLPLSTVVTVDASVTVATGAVDEATEGKLVRITGTITQPVLDDLPFGFIIFNRALSRTEIQTIVDAGSRGKCNSSVTPTPTPTPRPTPTPTATPTPTSSPTPPVGAVVLQVTRTGDLSQPGEVEYATQSGTALDRTDFTAAYGTLRFAAGQGSKSIVILITDDVYQEGQEAFTVTLSNPVGVSLGTPSTVTVQITSDDTATGGSPVDNASFDSERYVRYHYADFLNRLPDASGLAFWKGQLDECEQRPAAERQGCLEVKRVNVSAAFFLSIEFQETGYLVYRLHQAAFNTGEHLQLSRFLHDTQEIRQGVVVGQGNWEQQLEANKQLFAERFVTRAEFLAQYPTTMTTAQFVDALNANTNGSLSQAERDAVVNQLAAAGNTVQARALALRAVADDADFRARETNRAFVLMQYFGYLRRNPPDSPDLTLDFQGYNFWLTKLNQFGGDFVRAEMVKAFIISTEYRQRFGQ